MNKARVEFFNSLLSKWYEASVMSRGSTDATLSDMAAALETDADLRTYAEAEAGRLNSTRQSCFVSGVSADFLASALAYEPPPSASLLPSVELIPTPPDEVEMSKLRGLADLAKTITSDVENRADAALSRLSSAQAKAHGGLDKLDGVTAEIEKGAADIENFANQVTNGQPTE